MNAPEMRQNALSATQQRQCEGCPILFTPKRSWQKFHSEACKGEYHRKKRLGPDGRLVELEQKVEALRAGADELNRRVAALEAMPK